MSQNADKLLKDHFFRFNQHDHGDESFSLRTKMYSNGDPGGIYYNQELSLQSGCNSASFQLVGCVLTPTLLRQLADQLQLVEFEAKLIASNQLV